MIEEPDIPTRPRVSSPRIDENTVKGLLSPDLKIRDQWLVTALKTIQISSLACVEEAIARLSRKKEIIFFQTGGDTPDDPQTRKFFADKVVLLAISNLMLENPARTQSCMARLGKEQHTRLMGELAAINPKSQLIYQLLGIQMQLAILLERTGKIEA